MQCATLSKPDTGRSNDRQPAGEIHFEHFVQPLAHKRNDRASSRGVRSKQDYSRMVVNRVALEIGDALVEREQDPIGSQRGIHNCRICRAAKSFVDDRVSIVAQAAKILRQLN